MKGVRNIKQKPWPRFVKCLLCVECLTVCVWGRDVNNKTRRTCACIRPRWAPLCRGERDGDREHAGVRDCQGRLWPCHPLLGTWALGGITVPWLSLCLLCPEWQALKLRGGPCFLHPVFQGIRAITPSPGDTLSSASSRILMFPSFRVKKSLYKKMCLSVALWRTQVPGGDVKGSREACLKAQSQPLAGLREASWPAQVCSEMLLLLRDHFPPCRRAKR